MPAVWRRGGGARWSRMLATALRPLTHLVAWPAWHSMRVSLLDDLDGPHPPPNA